ncbi:MAG: glycosyltransferase, partial [Deltaproteobacteria bacterium]|nr:glycosyltransferase [Deltaproteobacteria bacterium]
MEKTAIHLCHDYKMPFFDVAQQYSDVLKNDGYKVVTVFLRGDNDESIERKSISDETLFYGLTAKEIKGLKIRLVCRVIKLCKQYEADLIVAHRSKAIYLSSMASFFLPQIKILGVTHRYGFFQRHNRKLLAYMRKKNLRLIGVSNAIRDDIRKLLPGFNAQHIQTLYNRLDFSNVMKTFYSRK